MNRAKTFASTVASAIATLVLLCMPMVAHAFSAFEDGSPSKPYRIGNCAQLQSINSNLSAHYVLVRDIDCSATTFNTIASSGAFTGTLDGRSHTVRNIDISGNGLFGATNGATIKNIRLDSGSVSDRALVGSFVSEASNTLFDNVHSSLTIDAASNTSLAGAGVYVGGIAAFINTGSIIRNSSYSGTMSGNTYVGGLVGNTDPSGTDSIIDSYSTGTLELKTLNIPPLPQTPVYSAGVLGASFTTTQLTRVYSSMTITIDDDAVYIGGVHGLGANTTITDSFSAATLVNTTGTYIGALTATNPAVSGSYYDSTLSGGRSCSGTGAVSCTGQSDSDYFKNNSTNAPFNSWDFTNVWRTTSEYPELRSLEAFDAAAVLPNGGDANGDATDDVYQDTVASAKNNSGVWSTVELTGGSCTVDDASAYDPNTGALDVAFHSALETMTAFNAYCDTPGSSVQVTIIFDKVYDTTGAQLRQYNPTTNSYKTITGATFGTRSIGGTPKTTVTYTLTDGGAYDTDGVADGRIMDPVAFGTAVPATTTTTSGAVRAPSTGVAPASTAVEHIVALFAVIALLGGLRVYHREKVPA